MTTQPTNKASFPHHRLDVCRVTLEIMVLGDQIAKTFPRGCAKLADQLRRATQSSYLQSVEGAARFGADQNARFQGARAVTCEAAGIAEGSIALGIGNREKEERLIALCDRAAAMLTALTK